MVKVKDGTDVNFIMQDMMLMSIILEGALDQEMDEELGYSKYDYRNKETDNSRNGHSQKNMHISYGNMEIDIPRDRKEEKKRILGLLLQRSEIYTEEQILVFCGMNNIIESAFRYFTDPGKSYK